MFLRPRTTPTPIMWPTVPQAKVSASVNPAGSPVCKPESLASSFSPAVAFLFADGANPNLPANSIKVVEATIICPTCQSQSYKRLGTSTKLETLCICVPHYAQII